MNERIIGLALGASLFSLVAGSSPASAQVSPGFSLDRYEPSERGSDFFALESLDLRGHLRPAAGVTGAWGYKPLVIYEPDGSERAVLVEHQFFLHLGGSIVLWDRVRFGLNLPIALAQAGQDGTLNGESFTAPDGASLGDLRLAADVRLLGEYGDPLRLAVGARFHVPTGDADAFAGDGSVRFTPRVLAAGDIDTFTYAASLGAQIRGRDAQFGGQAMGTDLNFGLAVGVRALDKRLVVGPELWGSSVLVDGGFFERSATPLEAILGARYEVVPSLRVGAGVGTGLTRGLGAPKVRTLLTLEWAPAPDAAPPPPPPPDRDRDSIVDAEDACPDQPGVATADPSTHGCPPPPPDRDGDGIADPDDACPDEPGVATADPKTNGCPPPPADRDGDGVADPDDACPDEPGVATADPETNGCPPPNPDRDGDGIANEQDACPDVAGQPNVDPKKHGCPMARVEGARIIITEQPKFATNSAKILADSNELLEQVRAVLAGHPEIKKVSVEGHTDSTGAKWQNKALSQQRAASVVKWLTDKGIAKERLVSVGHGVEKPIDTNATAEGRQNNRRVEFVITETAPAAPATPAEPAAPAPTSAASIHSAHE